MSSTKSSSAHFRTDCQPMLLRPLNTSTRSIPTARGPCAWAGVLFGMNQIDKAERILNSHIQQSGEEGYVVTNLAKLHATRNENDRAAAILWHALELDPNQKMAVGWFAALANERGGNSAMVEAWEYVCSASRKLARATVAGSRRARIGQHPSRLGVPPGRPSTGR